MSNRYFHALAEAPRHPRVAAWESYSSAPGVTSVRVAIARDLGPFGYGPAELIVLFRRDDKHAVKRDQVAWEEELDDWLISHGVRAVDDDHETHRVSLRLRDRFEVLLRQYGDGRFNAALTSALSRGPLSHDQQVAVVLREIQTPGAKGDAQSGLRVIEVELVLTRVAQQLTKSLGYDEAVGEKILGGAVAIYLMERFHIAKLPLPPKATRR